MGQDENEELLEAFKVFDHDGDGFITAVQLPMRTHDVNMLA